MARLCVSGRALLFRRKRVYPKTEQDIGTFQLCFERTSRAAVFTNSALIFFTMREAYFGPEFPSTLLVWFFFLLNFAVFFIMDLIDFVIPDVPEHVSFEACNGVPRQTQLV